MKSEQRQQAYNLFFQTNLSQLQIAKLLDVDRKTLHNWISEGNWRQQKRLAANMPSKISEQLYFMLANMNNDILSREGQPWPMTQEVDHIRKMTISLKNLKNRQTVNESMESYTLLAERISHKDPELAAKLNPYIQEMINDRVDLKFMELFSSEYTPRPALDQFPTQLTRPEDDDDPSVDVDALKEALAGVRTPSGCLTPEAEPAGAPPSGCLTSEAEPAGVRTPSGCLTPGAERAGVRTPLGYLTPEAVPTGVRTPSGCLTPEAEPSVPEPVPSNPKLEPRPDPGSDSLPADPSAKAGETSRLQRSPRKTFADLIAEVENLREKVNLPRKLPKPGDYDDTTDPENSAPVPVSPPPTPPALVAA